jgi:hypothetical protein
MRQEIWYVFQNYFYQFTTKGSKMEPYYNKVHSKSYIGKILLDTEELYSYLPTTLNSLCGYKNICIVITVQLFNFKHIVSNIHEKSIQNFDTDIK